MFDIYPYTLWVRNSPQASYDPEKGIFTGNGGNIWTKVCQCRFQGISPSGAVREADSRYQRYSTVLYLEKRIQNLFADELFHLENSDGDILLEGKIEGFDPLSNARKVFVTVNLS